MNEVIITINNVLNKFYGSIESEGYSILQKISIINKDIFLREPLKTICSENVKQYITLIINLKLNNRKGVLYNILFF